MRSGLWIWQDIASELVDELAPVKVPLIDERICGSRHINLLDLVLQNFSPLDHLTCDVLPRQFGMIDVALCSLVDIDIDQFSGTLPQHAVHDNVLNVARVGMQNDRSHRIVLCGTDHTWRSTGKYDQVCLLALSNTADSVSHLGSTGTADRCEIVGLFNSVVY